MGLKDLLIAFLATTTLLLSLSTEEQSPVLLAQPNNLHSGSTESDGWVNIQVFQGNPSILDKRIGRAKWHSQVRQDQLVADLFRHRKGGYFIDLAAHDAVHFSNTLALERQLDWSGLCIEANPEYWRDLTFRRCQVVGAAIGKSRMERVKFSLNEEFGGIIGNGFDNKEKEVHPFKKRSGELELFTVPLPEVLERNHVPKVIDYLSLDVEGAEMFIMDHFPFEQYTIRVLTVERPKKALRALLEVNGYQLLKIVTKWGETLWIHRTAVDSLDIDAMKKHSSFFPAQDLAATIPEE